MPRGRHLDVLRVCAGDGDPMLSTLRKRNTAAAREQIGNGRTTPIGRRCDGLPRAPPGTPPGRARTIRPC